MSLYGVQPLVSCQPLCDKLFSTTALYFAATMEYVK